MCFLPSLPVPLTAHASSWAQVPLPLLTLALLPLPFTLLYETYFLPNHALVLMTVYFLKRFPFSKEFCGHPVSLLLDHQLWEYPIFGPHPISPQSNAIVVELWDPRATLACTTKGSDGSIVEQGRLSKNPGETMKRLPPTPLHPPHTHTRLHV